MNEELDILPILVVADNQNKAEMLNSLLRARRLAVQPVWTSQLSEWQADRFNPEIIYYFADSGEEPLDTLIERARQIGAPLIVIGKDRETEEPASIIEAGAVEWVGINEDRLLAAVTRREHARAQATLAMRRLEAENQNYRSRLEELISTSKDAIAYLQDGVIVEANPAFCELLGEQDSKAVQDQPIMDFFNPSSQTVLKRELRKLARSPATAKPRSLRLKTSVGTAQEYTAELSLTDVDGVHQVRLSLHGASGGESAARKHLQALEQQQQALESQLHWLEQHDAGSKFLQPQVFAAVAAERVRRPLTKMVRAMVILRPADTAEALSRFSHLGCAEVGPTLSSTISPFMEEDDLASRIENLTLALLISRADEASIRASIQSMLDQLSETVLETHDKSSYIGFCAGYQLIDRVRHLDTLIESSLKAARGKAGTLQNSSTIKDTHYDQKMDHRDWRAFIEEALQERRFGLNLTQIQNLANGDQYYTSDPVLLDLERRPIPSESFMPSAREYGLTRAIEYQLLGYSFLTLLHLAEKARETRIIVPLGLEALADAGLKQFIQSLAQRTRARLAPKSLILELSLGEAASQIRETRQFALDAEQINCGIGFRDIETGHTLDQLLTKIQPDSLRTRSSLVERLNEAETAQAELKRLSELGARNKSLLIVRGVNDTNTMALLYNLGISIVEGSAISEAELFIPPDADKIMDSKG